MPSVAPPLTRTGRAVLSLAVSAAVLVVPSLAQPSIATAAIGSCAPATGGADGPFYPGPSASPAYNSTFAKGPAIPHTADHIPQGLTVWKDWDAKGHTLLLLGSYQRGRDSYLIGIDASSGKHVGTVRVAESHLGALGLAGKWLFATYRDTDELRKYKKSDLRDTMEKAAKDDSKPFLESSGGRQDVIGANFMSVYDGLVWAGRYSGAKNSSRMAQYKVSAKGKLIRVGDPYEVPLKTQGVLVTKNRFIFYSGLTAGTITVTDRHHSLSGSDGRCFVAPNFGENIVTVGDKVFLSFEGGSRHDISAANPITNLHTASLAKLDNLS